eukprot:gene12243-5828_t
METLYVKNVSYNTCNYLNTTTCTNTALVAPKPIKSPKSSPLNKLKLRAGKQTPPTSPEMRANLEISEILKPSKLSVGFSKNFHELKEEFMELRREFNSTPCLPSIQTSFFDDEDDEFQLDLKEEFEEEMYFNSNDTHLEFGLFSVSPPNITL